MSPSEKASMKVFLRQPQLAERWAMSVRSVLRARRAGRIPEPDFYLGQFPLWSVERIETFERWSAKRATLPTSASSESDDNLGAAAKSGS